MAADEDVAPVLVRDEELVTFVEEVRGRVSDVVDDDGELLAARFELLDDLLAQVDLARGAGDGDVTAEDLGDLDTKRAHTARAAVDKDFVSLLDVGRNGLERSQRGRRRARRLVQVDIVRDRAVAVQFSNGRVYTGDDEAADFDVVHIVGNGDDAAAQVHAGRFGVGYQGPGDLAKLGHLVVGGVDAGAGHLDEDPAILDLFVGGLGSVVGEGEDLGDGARRGADVIGRGGSTRYHPN
ncbi:unnamed protein product [Parascedosporium putredinis]|uniref:Uncharacterized protein n=1 Tax=Parascedosporium putredinis TaxID=1442378 RepID=A0A9P1H325_9PEZI|nr:unnamed protein product [Parascedosporium putredinis]CAI7996551.1 unnamed protein product [Parascedosporium putredinis]